MITIKSLKAVKRVFMAIIITGFMTLPAAADTLRVGEMWQIDGLDPAKEGTFVKEKALITETLVEADPNFALVPGLAQSWKMLSETTWEITLRPGVLFHNGESLTAKSVAQALTRNLRINPSLAGITRIKGISPAGDLILHIETDGLYPPLPATLVYADMAVAHPESKANDQGIIVHPIGTGPYKLKEWKRAEQKVLLEKFDDYWGEKARIGKIEFRSIPDPAIRSLEIQKGSVDLIPDAPYGDLDILRQKGLKVTIANTARVYQINFGSLKDTPFADVRVRKALSHAVNRDEIVRYVLFGMGRPAAGAYEDTMAFANPSLKVPAFDPELSRELLSAAGWKGEGKKGFRQKSGKPLALTLYTYPQRPGLVPMAMAIAQQWENVGVKADVRVMDWSAITAEMKPGDVRLAAFASAMIPDPDYFLRRIYSKTGSDNKWGYEHSGIEEMLEAGIRETHAAKRVEIYKKAQALAFEDHSLIHVSYYGVNIVTSPRVKGFVFNPVAHDYMLNTLMYLED
ncbi:MAG: ABC transporter substrate-binding protein [Desulfamplus sp.]|nr:ABC transporter substrate-binding protein [Desulfamplus sp.]